MTSEIPFAAPVLPLLQRFIGKPLTRAAMAEIERIITASYRERGRPFVAVVAPPQKVAGGVVRIVLSEYRAGRVRVLGARWFSTDQIRREVRQQSGRPIEAKRLEADLGRLNENPFLRVDVVAKPGTLPATTDLDLIVHDRFPVSAYAGYANDGSATTGLDRYKLGVAWGNAFGLGQTLGYQFTASGDAFARRRRPDGSTSASFIAQAVSWSAPLPWRHRLELFGDYEVDHPNLGPNLAGAGHSGEAGIRYVIPLPPAARFVEDLRLGYDFKTTDNNLDFGGTTVSAQSVETDQFPIIYQATLRDDLGQTTLANTLVLSPGGLSPRNTDAAFQPSATQSGVAFARARYVYDRVQIERVLLLPHGFTGIGRIVGQISSANLLPSEQLNVGGLDSVRGYAEYVAGGSQGVQANAEVRTPPVEIAPRLGLKGLRDALQGDVFTDYAHVTNVRDVPGAPASVDLTSVGVGVRYSLCDRISLRAELGRPLHTPSSLVRRSAFLSLTVTATPW